jgi:3'-5' exoribonuclease Rv2179c-like domain
MTENDMPEILVSVDGEFTGLIPGPHSMISLGAVAYDPDGDELSRFKVNICELPDANRDPTTMAWWAEHPEAWKASTDNPIGAAEAMHRFDRWLASLPGRPKLMGWPLPVDFMFVYWYYVNFLGKAPPFGYDGIDIKTYAMAQLKTATLSGKSSGVSRKMVQELLGIPTDDFSHDPVDDASQQGKLYFGLRALAQGGKQIAAQVTPGEPRR